MVRSCSCGWRTTRARSGTFEAWPWCTRAWDRSAFVMYMVGGIFGGLTAIAFGFDLLAPWLVIAYVLFAVAVLVGVTENRTWPLRLAEAVERTPDGPLTPEIRELFMNRRTVSALAIDIAWFFAIIFDMVIKPFS